MIDRHLKVELEVESVVTTVALWFGAVSALLLFCCGRGAEAQINFVFLPDTQTASPGAQVTFAATVTNTGKNTVYINNDNITFDGPATIDDTLFANSFTGSLAAGQSIRNKEIFTLTADTTAVPGTYLGRFNILGGGADAANNLLAFQNFQLVVEAVPESSSLLLLTLGLGGLTTGCLRSRKAQEFPTNSIRAKRPNRNVS